MEIPVVTDTTQDMQIRRSIQKAVDAMDLRLLQRIAYEVRCEEMGLHPDGWKLYPDEETDRDKLLKQTYPNYESFIAAVGYDDEDN